MEYALVYGIMFFVVALISWQWVRGIDYMHKNFPNYKGDDLFGEFKDTAYPENTKKENESDVDKKS